MWPERHLRRPFRGRALFAGILALGVAGAGMSPQAEARPQSADEDPHAVTSLAVLPFETLGTETEEFLGGGMTEDLISYLAQLGELDVTARASSMALRDTDLDLRQVADTLGVEHLLVGSVERSGNRVRVAARLVDPGTETEIWAEQYATELAELSRVQEAIARDVSELLLGSAQTFRSPSARSRSDVPEVFELFLRGRQALQSRAQESLREGMDAFERAIRMDPEHAPPHAGLSIAHSLWVTYGYVDELEPYEAYAQAVRLGDRAVALDPEHVAAYPARGYVTTRAWAPADDVEADFLRALELEPGSADAHGWFAHFLAREEAFGRSLEAARRAIELDPLAAGRRVGFAVNALAAREYEEARREASTARALAPALGLPRALEARALLLLGRPDDCLELDLSPFPAMEAICVHEAGREAEARNRIDALAAGFLEGSVGQSAGLARDLATYHAWTGQSEEALRWTERAFALSPDGVDFRHVQSGLFDRVLSEPTFAAGWDRLKEETWSRVSHEARDGRP